MYLEPTQADNPGAVYDVDTAECGASQVIVEIDGFEGPPLEGNSISNTCPADLRIKEYVNFCGSNFNNNGSPIGTTIPAGEERLIGFCEPINDTLFNDTLS